jgi:hypothetical protein
MAATELVHLGIGVVSDCLINECREKQLKQRAEEASLSI